MKIIGVCGRKRHGKDTVGGFLKEEFGYTPIAFADPIKRIAMDLYGFTYEQVYGSEKEIPDTRWDGLTPRHAMQQIGTEVARAIHSETWVRYCLQVIEDAAAGKAPMIHSPEHRGFVPASDEWCNLSQWVICDVRFSNEADAIHKVDGHVIKVVRPDLEGKQGDAHASEVGIDKIDADFTIINESTLDHLANETRRAAGVLFG